MLRKLMRARKKLAAGVAVTVTLSCAALAGATYFAITPLPDDLSAVIASASKNTYLDRRGKRLNITYENEWNIYDVNDFHNIPEFLRRAFVLSEDKRFFSHGGVDWLARLNATRQNVMSGGVVRGASTISEQVVRMLHPRPRTPWSRWIEGFEAANLEAQFSKVEILEFYLNQVPYSARRRGVMQAAQYYFGRDLSTLNYKEMLALAVLVRSPRWLDPQRQLRNLNRAIDNLLDRLELDDDERAAIAAQSLELQKTDIHYDLSHFIRFAENRLSAQNLENGAVYTTIDTELQTKIQQTLDNRLDNLTSYRVQNGAVLVIDHESNEILSWVVGYAGRDDKPFNRIDAITTPRQPGSTLKPLLYANAIRKGWTAATMLDDSPLQESVGLGMHTYHNYSRGYYGRISLREALGNSLNIPAVLAIQYVGPGEFLNFLHDLGVDSLSGHPNVYGDGLALGNGEMTLFELVQAYSVLARMGDFRPLSFTEGSQGYQGHRVLSEDISSLVADIMSDPAAREKEFGWDSVLNFPHQTAVKTGTSSDYRDAWSVGFNDKYTVGVWMGNLDYAEMNKVTGSMGPAYVLRSVFNELNKNREVKPLYLSSNLQKLSVCINTGELADNGCESRDEWFLPGTTPGEVNKDTGEVRIRKPSKGLLMAMDPRIPDESEYFEFALTEADNIKSVKWFINGQLVATTDKPTYNWKLSKGDFATRAEIAFTDGAQSVITEEIQYRVN
ncbi:transglycosylase domain-containing protein [Hahella aquimaris]|uniref:transglycosylase domain-containing protein n=1 Tax=Hahella sp. HNIBRBA332 TaxID=3015983 RepID=UPI00273B7D7B|nr:transglycosylase domain-containing protein [Hahella sp. HNIBRBA332]WLQ13087.1 transglycosylase domain-containing protein [Hahella sp. HNIBRBA332]